MNDPASLGRLKPIALALGAIIAAPAIGQETPVAEGPQMVLEEMVVTPVAGRRACRTRPLRFQPSRAIRWPTAALRGSMK